MMVKAMKAKLCGPGYDGWVSDLAAMRLEYAALRCFWGL